MRVFEHGVTLTDIAAPAPGLHLVATTDLPVYAHYSMTIVDRAERSLNERIVALDKSPGPRRRSEYFEEADVRSGLLAVAYHVERLASLYSTAARLFEDRHPEVTVRRGNTHEPRAYYEADALMSAGRRWYESVLRLVWKHEGKGDRPKSFHRLLNCHDVIPAGLLATLTESWERYGRSLKDHRDAIAHYDPLDDGGKTMWASRFDGHWGITVKLPANPSARSRARYDFETGPDVLSYAHELICHMADVAEAMNVWPTVVAHRNRPYP